MPNINNRNNRCPEHEREHGRLFEFQCQLPRLPVPDLDSTLVKYTQSLEPLLPAVKFAESKRIIEEFGQSALAKQLQQRLIDRAGTQDNWLEEWWNDLSYMGYRDPVIPYVSYHYSFNDDPLCSRPNQRAARLIAGAMKFRQMVVDSSLEPEMAKTTPLCSHSYKFMFNGCRVPQKPSDTFRTVKYSGNDTVVVIRNGQFFLLDLNQQQQQPLPLGEIETNLDSILEIADSGAAVPVGILTADNRDYWADNRKMLLEASPMNAEVLDVIESAAFVVCLEPSRPVTREELSHSIWHGNGRNRWFDKPCQFVVCDNGRAGFNGEHSMMDGTPTLRLVEYVIEHSPKPENAVQASSRSGYSVTYRQLKFHTPPSVVQAVKKADMLFQEGISKQHLSVLNHDAYGKEEIKRLGFSPDSYLQMAIQLAYTRLHGCARPTYESSMTRKFLHGRTETCRSLSSESVAWCRAMIDRKQQHQPKDTNRCAELFRSAVTKHTKLVKEAVEGQGVDRHLLGLRMVLDPQEKKPLLFEDPAYSYSSHWYLSTSQISSSNFTSYGWSEVSPKGYGIAYNIRGDSLVIHVACMRNEYGLNSDHLTCHLEAALKDIREMLLAR